MISVDRVGKAFSSRICPQSLTEGSGTLTPEQQDAFWFAERDWRDIDWSGWECHCDAFFSFSPPAFIYFLPSIIVISASNQSISFLPAESLLQILDRIPISDYLDDFIINRLGNLYFEEYDILIDWLLSLSDGSVYDDNSLRRSFDMVYILKENSVIRQAQSY